MDFVGGAVSINDTHAIAEIATCGEVAFADTLKEFSLFAFEAVGGATTNGHALAACFNGQVENYSEFWEATATSEFRKALDLISTEPAGITLVSKCAPRKTVGEVPGSSLRT